MKRRFHFEDAHPPSDDGHGSTTTMYSTGLMDSLTDSSAESTPTNHMITHGVHGVSSSYKTSQLKSANYPYIEIASPATGGILMQAHSPTSKTSSSSSSTRPIAAIAATSPSTSSFGPIRHQPHHLQLPLPSTRTRVTSGGSSIGTTPPPPTSTSSFLEKQRHSASETRRRERLRARFSDLQNAAGVCLTGKKDRGSILTQATEKLKELKEKVRVLEQENKLMAAKSTAPGLTPAPPSSTSSSIPTTILTAVPLSTPLNQFGMLASVAACYLSLDGRILDANAAFMALFHFTSGSTNPTSSTSMDISDNGNGVEKSESKTDIYSSSIFAMTHHQELIPTLSILRNLLCGVMSSYECSKRVIDVRGDECDCSMTIASVLNNSKIVMFLCLFVPKANGQHHAAPGASAAAAVIPATTVAASSSMLDVPAARIHPSSLPSNTRHLSQTSRTKAAASPRTSPRPTSTKSKNMTAEQPHQPTPPVFSVSQPLMATPIQSPITDPQQHTNVPLSPLSSLSHVATHDTTGVTLAEPMMDLLDSHHQSDDGRGQLVHQPSMTPFFSPPLGHSASNDHVNMTPDLGRVTSFPSSNALSSSRLDSNQDSSPPLPIEGTSLVADNSGLSSGGLGLDLLVSPSNQPMLLSNISTDSIPPLAPRLPSTSSVNITTPNFDLTRPLSLSSVMSPVLERPNSFE